MSVTSLFLDIAPLVSSFLFDCVAAQALSLRLARKKVVEWKYSYNLKKDRICVSFIRDTSPRAFAQLAVSLDSFYASTAPFLVEHSARPVLALLDLVALRAHLLDWIVIVQLLDRRRCRALGLDRRRS